MATITATTNMVGTNVHKATWLALATSDVGSNLSHAAYADKTVQISGTFGGATATLKGSNDSGTMWFTLNDLDGSPISVTTAAMVGVRENPELVRPEVAGGSGVVLNYYLVSKRST